MSYHIVIGICTCRRSKLLAITLHSLENMKKPDNCNLSVIVADNDPTESAEHVVEKFKTLSDIPVQYLMETKAGIPFARNRILNEALSLNTDYLAFIDDDEYVEKDWLITLWRTFNEFSADVLIGFVRTVYPDHTPDWIKKGNFYQRDKVDSRHGSTLLQEVKSLFTYHPWDGKSNKTNGTILDSGRTCNVFFDFNKLIVNWGMRFDESFGLRGGSDAEFFLRAIEKGAVIRSAEYAVVNEILMDDRMTLSYLIRRSFKTRNYEHEKTSSFCKRLRMFIKGIILFFSGAVSFPLNIFRGKYYMAQTLKAVTASIGLMLSAINVFIVWDEYKR